MGSCLVNSLTFTVLRIHHFFIFCQENGKYVEWFVEMCKSTFKTDWTFPDEWCIKTSWSLSVFIISSDLTRSPNLWPKCSSKPWEIFHHVLQMTADTRYVKFGFIADMACFWIMLENFTFKHLDLTPKLLIEVLNLFTWPKSLHY